MDLIYQLIIGNFWIWLMFYTIEQLALCGISSVESSYVLVYAINSQTLSFYY